jgi:AcrR family transcriptional regulator
MSIVEGPPRATARPRTESRLTAGRPRARGRKRDASIDARVIEVASRHLAARGFDGVSLAAVADEAGTTRQALYRRWPTKADLLDDAIRLGADRGCLAESDDPRRDLERELADFERTIDRPGALSIVGTMLQESTPGPARECYRAHAVAPRRERLRQILASAQRRKLIDPQADLDIAVSFATGAWYARALAGQSVPKDWAKRTATLIWRAVGGAAAGPPSG